MPTGDGAVTDDALVTSRVLDAPRARVYAAFADPRVLADWWGPEGFTTTITRFELRPGGTWTLDMRGPDGAAYAMTKEFVEVVPAERVVIRHPQEGHAFTLTLAYDDAGDGRTRLTWRMRFDDPAELARVREVVTAANEQNLDRLARRLAAGDGARRATRDSMTTIPTLETGRLLLRPFRPDDFPAYAALVADPEVTRHLADGRPLSRDEAWRQMAMFVGHWTLRGFGVWAVEERATGAFLGRIGCFEPEGWPAFEIAYTLGRAAWGRGYATEGARAALRYAHEVLGRRGVTSVIRPDNARSIRVATGLGARFEREAPFFGGVAHVYVYPDPDGHAAAS